MTNFPENNTVVDTYRIIKEIGRGGMAESLKRNTPLQMSDVPSKS